MSWACLLAICFITVAFLAYRVRSLENQVADLKNTQKKLELCVDYLDRRGDEQNRLRDQDFAIQTDSLDYLAEQTIGVKLSSFLVHDYSHSRAENVELVLRQRR